MGAESLGAHLSNPKSAAGYQSALANSRKPCYFHDTMTRTATPFVQAHASENGLLQVLKSGGVLLSVAFLNSSDDLLYLFFFDASNAEPPVEGDSPSFVPVPVPAGGYYESDTQRGFALGCWIGASTTRVNFTQADEGVAIDAGGSY
jgi:hypothetical protein